ncbi:MAG TPA: penicillin-binding protein 2 [Gaiellaceae bacterium]|jgi:cell division protein FtsI/penicillin-binding protein 2|nr:penicillin-binding protein 2 [Gaiellaceae bacterium]
MKLANRRIRLVLAVFAVAFAAMFARAAWLQGVRAGSFERLADGQHRATLVDPGGRGGIYDRTGVQLAVGRQATSVYANPRQVRDPEALAAVVGHALRVDPAEMQQLLSDRSRGFVYLVRKADPTRAAALKRMGIVGLGFIPEEQRVYPLNHVAAQVVGYAGTDNHGLAGLELGLERKLSGKPGSETVVRDPSGRAISVLESTAAHEGQDVYLTIDHTIQAQAEAVLRSTLDRWHAKSASAIVLDPRTGDILAMAVERGYDANQFPIIPRDLQRNRAVTDTYEPGSTFKIVTVSAVLSEGLVTPRTAFTLPYEIHVADRVIRDAHPRGTERLTVDEILSQSSNVGTITLAEKLGSQRLSDWIGRFGFGHRTGIDFPGESPGIIPSLARWSGSTIGTLPIGHGVAVTPVQMAAAYATVANEGVWLRPHFVDRIGAGGRPTVPSRRVLAPRVAGQVLSMMRDVVLEGTGQEAKLPGYEVAGKTGTAAKPDPSGGYSTSRYVASFVGIVPATRPRVVILVTIDEPQASIWGGVVAAPAFQEIARFDLQYLEIPPDSPLP